MKMSIENPLILASSVANLVTKPAKRLMDDNLSLRAGDIVEVRSQAEILSTLDRNGRLENLPFMPQMFQYCGQRFRVYKRAHKTCDTVNEPAGRRMNNAVHLEGIRCDGQAYGGCQAGCLIFWKVAWLKKASVTDKSEPDASEHDVDLGGGLIHGGACTESDVWAGTKVSADADIDDPTYVCQITQLPSATRPLSPWDVRQYFEDYASGNVSLLAILSGFIYATYNNTMNLGIGVGAIMRWFYDKFQALRGGIPYPRRWGTIPAGQPTPAGTLDLEPGELVKVKSYEEILKTVDTSNKNRGLYFDAEMVPFCGGTYRVRTRVNRILDEKTGKMMRMKNACIILEDVFCRACYSEKRYFCPRAIYSYWREIWLERAPTTTPASQLEFPER